MNSQLSRIMHLIDDYKYACIRYYLNDNMLIDGELYECTVNKKFAIVDALNLLVGGSK